ncbi:hypothetical protein TWF481_000550 [Arthrobotrys musiformis]|uniref:Uncharacterized protein n=1 Tax=Arthrobotrys musiformis TaxID=47236 RepID=A0AAV9WN26_9PEZI
MLLSVAISPNPAQTKKRAPFSGGVDIWQWYYIDMLGEGDDNFLRRRIQEFQGLPNGDTAAALESPPPQLGSPGRTVKRDVNPPLINSTGAISTITTTTTKAARTTPVPGLDKPQNSTMWLPPSVDGLNFSRSLEPRVGGDGMVETDVWIHCPTPQEILDNFTLDFYRSRGITHAPDWRNEIPVSSVAEVLKTIQRKLADCQECECQTETEVNNGAWGLTPSPTSEECRDRDSMMWCAEIMGCYCEEVAEISGNLPTTDRFLLARVSPGRYLRGRREHLGVAWALQRNLQDRMQRMEGYTEDQVESGPPVPEMVQIQPVLQPPPEDLQNMAGWGLLPGGPAPPSPPEEDLQPLVEPAPNFFGEDDEVPTEQLPPYDNIGPPLPPPPPPPPPPQSEDLPRYVRNPSSIRSRISSHFTSRFWSNFIAGAGGAIGFQGRSRNRFQRGGGSGSRPPRKRSDPEINASSEKEPVEV